MDDQNKNGSVSAQVSNQPHPYHPQDAILKQVVGQSSDEQSSRHVRIRMIRTGFWEVINEVYSRLFSVDGDWFD